jgi:hypothetical protein
VATLMNGGLANSVDLKPIRGHSAVEIEHFDDFPVVKRVPREPEPPEQAARTCEEPESRQTNGWEAPDGGVDDFPHDDRELVHGRSRG